LAQVDSAIWQTFNQKAEGEGEGRGKLLAPKKAHETFVIPSDDLNRDGLL
jgi:hypothetical protein